MDSKKILMQMRPEDCVMIPPRPGYWWVGELVDPDPSNSQSYLNGILSDLRTEDKTVELQNAWIYMTQQEIVQREVRPGQIQVGLNKMGMLLPVCDMAPHKGVTINVPATLWIWPTGSMLDELDRKIEEAGVQLMSSRSNLSIASPTMPPPTKLRS